MCLEGESGRGVARVGGRRWIVALVVAISLAIACASDEEKVARFKGQAETYVEEGKLAEAVIEYRNVLQIDPNDAEAHRGLAMAYLQLGSIGDAYWELSETIRLDPADRESRNTYAAISLANGRYDAVLEQADALIEQDPEDDVGYVLRAQAYERLGREAEVEPLMREVIERNPDRTEYRLLLANFFLRQGDAEAAREEVDAAMAADPSYTGAALLVRIAATKGDDAETERWLKRAIELANEEHAERVAAGETGVDSRGDAYQTAARFYIARERPDGAVAILEEGIENIADVKEARLQLMYMLASVYREGGEEEKASEVMRQAAASDEGNPDPYLVLSTYRTGQEDFDGALEAAEQAMAIAPDSLKSRLRHAEALVEYGAARKDDAKLEQGREEVEALLEQYPGLPEALFVRAKLAMAEGDSDRAIETLTSALEGKPDWAQARLLLGTALTTEGELARARVELAMALELDPSLVAARRGLVRIHAALDEHEYAIEQARLYLKERPRDAQMRVVLAQSLIRLGRTDEARRVLLVLPEEQMGPRAQFALARIELASGDRAEARRLLEIVEQSQPYNVRVLETFVTLDRAEGRMDESVARLQAAIDANPEDAELYELQGLVATIQGDIDAAEASYTKAIELDPTRMVSYSRLASIYNAQGRIDETIKIYEKAVAEDPDAAEAHHFLAVLYEMTGKSDLAKKHYDRAIASDDSMAESKNNLAYLLASRGQELDRALTLAQEAKAAMPGNPNTADTLGWVLLKRGVPSAATGYFREALANMPPDDQARGEVGYHLGLSYAAAGQSDQAIEAFEEALDYLGKQLDAAQAAGDRVSEPAWASQARAEIKKLSS